MADLSLCLLPTDVTGRQRSAICVVGLGSAVIAACVIFYNFREVC